jgi:hypothetical protein
MPRGVRLLRWWPAREPVQIAGYPHVIDNPAVFIAATLKRLDRKLRSPGSEVFSTEGLVHRLGLLGCLVEIEETRRKRRRADARTACHSGRFMN